jgi:ATP:ADP antiporter, AAA family
MSSCSYAGGLISSLLKKWFGPFTKDELKKYLFLGLILAVVIGTYWTMRPLKDAIFGSVVGKGKWLAWAKIVSMLTLFPVVVFYGKMVDRFQRHRLFYFLCTLYGVLMIFWGIFFALPGIGLANSVTDPFRISGWLWYVFVESFGSLVVALFWAFAADISDPKSARYGFPVILLIAQLGGILGPKMLKHVPSLLGSTTTAPLVGFLSIFIFSIAILIMIFMRVTPKDQLKSYKAAEQVETHKEEPGFLDGLKLLLSHGYLFGIFIIISVFEVVATFFDFNFKTLVMETYASDVARNFYLQDFASMVNTVAFFCILFGVNNIQRWLGVRFTLALMPFIIGGAVFMFMVYPELSVLYWIVVGAKAINYALNGPTIKQLYIPTTEDAKYKSQAWIETFGSRGAKGGASAINSLKDALGAFYLMLTVYISFGILVLWFFVALYLGRKYNTAIKEKRVVC